MKFLKLNSKHYVRYDDIKEVLAQQGGSDGVQVVIGTATHGQLIYKRGIKDYTEAEKIIRELVDRLEYSDGATALYSAGSTSNH